MMAMINKRVDRLAKGKRRKLPNEHFFQSINRRNIVMFKRTCVFYAEKIIKLKNVTDLSGIISS
jgi:hypothetical protein